MRQGERAEHCSHQRRLPRPVGSGQTQTITPVDLEIDRAESERSPVDDGTGQPGHHRPGALRLLDGEAELPSLPWLLHLFERGHGPVGLARLGRQLLGPVDPEPPLGLVVVLGGSGLLGDPFGGPLALLLGPALELRAPLVVGGERFGGMSSSGDPFGLVASPAAAELPARVEMLVELEDGGDSALEEGTVVGYKDQAPRTPGDPRLEPLQPGEIEVVGRFVEQGDRVTRQFDGGQRHLRLLASGQGGGAPVSDCRPNPQVVEHRVDPGVEVGRAQGSEPLEGHGVAVVGRTGAQSQAGGCRRQLVLGGPGPGASGQHGAHGLAGCPLVLLGQVPDGGRRRVEGDRSGIGLVEAGEEAQQRRLADSVGTGDPDAALWSDGQRHPLENGAAGAFRAEVAGDQGGGDHLLPVGQRRPGRPGRPGRPIRTMRSCRGPTSPRR